MKASYNRSEIQIIKNRLFTLVEMLLKSSSTKDVKEMVQELKGQIHHYDSVLSQLRNETDIITEYSLCQGFNSTELLLNEIERNLK